MEYCRYGESHIGNTFKNDVASHIDQDSNTNGNEQKNRLKEGFAHQKQNDNTNCYSHGNKLVQNIQLCAGIVAVNRVGIVIYAVHFSNNCTYAIVVTGIIGLYDIHAKGFGIVLNAIQLIVNTHNAFKLGKLFVNGFLLCGS